MDTASDPARLNRGDTGSHLVFVRKTGTAFEPRRITVGLRNGPLWEVKTGLRDGELVVTTGSFLFKTELMKGSIGAGCCK